MAVQGNLEKHHAIEVVTWLNLATKQGKWWFHVPNERKCNPYHGYQLKLQGVHSGVSDFVFLRPANGYNFLVTELKANKKRKPTQEQLDFIESVKLEGGWGEVLYGAKEAIKYIAEFYGLPTLGFI